MISDNRRIFDIMDYLASVVDGYRRWRNYLGTDTTLERQQNLNNGERTKIIHHIIEHDFRKLNE